ncbi:MAG TPA: HAMP domain-containing sensor histidine kinase [Trebonia sp.]|nr:HAMP domain-containing sensor histidine kinase [Trebonia sp.]
MAGQETLSSHPEKRPRLSGGRKRLSDRTPLRTKLITAVLALVIMAIAAIGVASTYMLRNYVTTQHDRELTIAMNHVFATGGKLAGDVSLGAAAPTQSNVVEGLQQPGQQLSWGVFSNLPGMGNPDPLPRLPTNGLWTGQALYSTSGPFSAPAQSGTHTWRVLAMTVTLTGQTPGQQTTAILVVAEDIGNINALTMRLILFDVIVGGAIVIVLAAVGAGVVQANLRPLNDIELTAGQIAAGHLDHRVPEGDPRTEIGSLSRSLNAMLSQIERAFHAQGDAEQAAHRSEERMRRFIADAAHELRTPLTTIRGFAAHYRLRGGASRLRPGSPAPGNAGAASAAEGTAVINGTDGAGQNPVFRTDSAFTGPASSATDGPAQEGLSPDELDHLMSRVESEATRMGMLVEDLLTLARLDQQRPVTKAPVDLLTLAVDVVQDARIVAPGRPIDLIVAPGTAFLIDGDEPRLRQVLANLVNNALTHTPAGTPVRVKIARGLVETNRGARATGTSEAEAVWQTVPAVVLDVEDDGPGMTADQAQRVFERFYRADAARNRASGGTGLGLAIVAGLVSAHAGTVSVRTAPGKGADFQVKLPLSPDALPLDDPDSAEDLPD